MNKFIATTAVALFLGAPAFAQTTDQTQEPAAGEEATQDQAATGMQDGFVQGLEMEDILASELIGQEVYAAQDAATDPQAQEPADQQAAPAGQPPADEQATDQEAAPADQQAAAPAGQETWGATMTQDRLQTMDNIGQVSEVVIDQNGEVRALVIGVGGFLGIGEHEVGLTFDQLSFATDEQDPSLVYVIANTTQEALENAPEFDRSAHEERMAAADQQAQQPPAGDPAATDAWRADRDPFAAPQLEREGFQQAELGEVSVDTLIGSNVYDVNDQNIGSVGDVIMEDDGELQYAIIDVGGFLGLGTHDVALGLDEMTIMHDEGWNELRVYVDATQEQLEAMPEYAAAN